MNAQVPKLKSGLILQSLDGQTLVFDPSTDGVHLLDPTTGVVFDLLQRGFTREAVATELENRLGLTAGEEFYDLAVQQLDQARLLTDEPASRSWESVDRREVIRRVAAVSLSTLLVPAIITVTASPAHATSGGTGVKCAACTNSSQCSGISTTACGANGACFDPGKPNGASCGQGAVGALKSPCGTTARSAANAQCCTNCLGGTIASNGTNCVFTVLGTCG